MTDRDLDAKKVWNRENKWDQTIAGGVLKIAGRAGELGNQISKVVREKHPDNFSAANALSKEMFAKCYEALAEYGVKDPFEDFNDIMK